MSAGYGTNIICKCHCHESNLQHKSLFFHLRYLTLIYSKIERWKLYSLLRGWRCLLQAVLRIHEILVLIRMLITF
jgi:hypothetical protein